MSAKAALYDFLREQLTTVIEGEPLAGALLRFTHHEYTKQDDAGIHLSNVNAAPRPSGEATVEFDAKLIITTYVRVEAAPDRDERAAAYERCNAMALTIAGWIWADTGLGGRTCNTFVGQMVDSFDSLSHGEQHAVTNLYVTVNQSGAPLPGLWGGA